MLEFAKRVHLELNTDFADTSERRPSKVEIRLKDGKTLSRYVEYSKGGPQAPLSALELKAKFVDCAKRVIDDTAMHGVLEYVESLESLERCRASMPPSPGRETVTPASKNNGRGNAPTGSVGLPTRPSFGRFRIPSPPDLSDQTKNSTTPVSSGHQPRDLDRGFRFEFHQYGTSLTNFCGHQFDFFCATAWTKDEFFEDFSPLNAVASTAGFYFRGASS